MYVDNNNYSITRKYLLAFLSLFSDLSIIQKDSKDDIFRTVKVPVIFANNEKWFQFSKSPISGRLSALSFGGDNIIEISANLPMMSVNSWQIQLDTENQFSKHQKIKIGNYEAYTPVVYSMNVELNVLTGLLDNNNQIIESILPYFLGALNININLGDDPIMSNLSIPVKLNTVSLTAPIDISESENRIIGTQLQFTLQNILYFPKLTTQQFSTLNITIVDE